MEKSRKREYKGQTPALWEMLPPKLLQKNDSLNLQAKDSEGLAVRKEVQRLRDVIKAMEARENNIV